MRHDSGGALVNFDSKRAALQVGAIEVCDGLLGLFFC